jgi:sporulation protein YlmC with PRC-barrel domain
MARILVLIKSIKGNEGISFMQKAISELKGYALGATDGEIGSVSDFLFDDNFWTVRYLVADTSKWLPGRRVLISPIALGKIDWHKKIIPVSLTQDQVKHSPDLDSRHFSRDKESAYFDYYGWPYYWVGGDIWGAEISPGGLAAAQKVVTERVVEEAPDTTLRSASEMMGYYIEATDGDIGHVEDLVVDDDTWELRYLIVNTQNWWPGKKVLVSPEWIDRISWSDSKVYIDLSRQAIQSSPEYDPAALDRTYEERLYEHYGRPPYWNA